MRGIAAVVVVLFHTSLVAQPYLQPTTVGSTWWWIADTPLKLFTAGAEAVLIFFVLSGLVVALPAFKKGYRWLKYYPTRIIRLYVPSVVALIFGAALILLVHRSGSAAVSGYWAYDTNARSVPPMTFLADLSLMKAGNGVDNVLWSLRWEIFFSLLLPLFVFLALKVRRFWLIAIVACLAVTATGTGAHLDPRLYLPVFFIGTLMALHIKEIKEWAQKRSRAFWIAAFAASCLALIGSHTLTFLFPTASIVGHILTGMVGAGASGLIFCAIGFPGFRNFLNTRFSQFFGKISFSLYLVHVPIIATLTYFLGEQLWWIVAVVGIPLSIGVAVLFFQFVEKPSQKFAHFVGAKFAGLRTPTPQPETQPVSRPDRPASTPVSTGIPAEANAAR
jgi:peptidoglycan/LPS O-acetylase OafA/YrhL